MTYKSNYKQSIFDISAEQFGTINNVADIVRKNRLVFDGALPTGTNLDIATDGKGILDVKNEIQKRDIYCNNNDTLPIIGQGIGFMIIESTNIVG